MRYLISKGSRIWLKKELGAGGQAFITERSVILEESDVHLHSKDSLDDPYYVFYLPKNDRGFLGFSVYAHNVEEIDK
jgi:hypothetical protein